MFKRRFAVLGAVAVLVLTGLGGSALAADEPTVPGVKVTCTTADGKPVTMERALPAGTTGVRPARPIDGELPPIEEGKAIEVTKLPNGEGIAVRAVPATKLATDEDVEWLPTRPMKAGDAPAVGKTLTEADGVNCVTKK